MSSLYCAECGGEISATHKKCPHCGARLRLWNDIRRDVEKSRLRLALVVIAALLLLGFGWFLRMDAGYKAPLYIIIVLVAPIVPWLLSLAYKSASPAAGEAAPAPQPPSGARVKLQGAGLPAREAGEKTADADKGRA